MADKEVDYSREVRDTIVKSSLTGVAATVLAVALASPAGFGGMIGTSVASGSGSVNTSEENNPYAALPAYPAPLTQQEVTDIRGQLAVTAASLEITRAATEAKIDFVRGVALRGDLMVVASNVPSGIVAPQIVRAEAAETPVAVAEVGAPIQAPVMSSSFAAPLHDPHLELAALLLDENL